MITRNLKPKKTSPYPNTIVCENCDAIFGIGLEKIYCGYHKKDDTSNNSFVNCGSIKLAKGECPICRHINSIEENKGE